MRDQDRQREKVARFAYHYGSSTQAMNRTLRQDLTKCRTTGRGVWMHEEWLKRNLPPAVYRTLAFIQPAIEDGKIEVGFLDGRSIMFPRRRREFMVDTTLARICLEAP
jgi:hypothetical protein